MAANEIHIIFEKPDGTKVVNDASFKTDGNDGIIRYTTSLATELDQQGSWKIQANVTLPIGKWSSDIDRFRVYENL